MNYKTNARYVGISQGQSKYWDKIKKCWHFWFFVVDISEKLFWTCPAWKVLNKTPDVRLTDPLWWQDDAADDKDAEDDDDAS